MHQTRYKNASSSVYMLQVVPLPKNVRLVNFEGHFALSMK